MRVRRLSRGAGKSVNSTTMVPNAQGLRRAAAFLAFVPAAWATTAAAQFGTSVNVVEIYASVTNEEGEPVQGLGRDQFIVLEDGRRQTVDTFVEGDFPLSVAVALDRSLSMAGERLTMARSAARTFMGQLRPADQAMVIAISGQVEVAVPLSTDRAAALAAIDRLDPWSTTALHDAILLALEKVQAGTGRRALVLVSDGNDRYSEAAAGDVVAAARTSDVMIYPVALGRDRPRLFVELAAATGGRSFHARDRHALDETMQSIARELRHQYLLGYSPTRSLSEGPGEWRAIRLEVSAPGARVRAREGYIND